MNAEAQHAMYGATYLGCSNTCPEEEVINDKHLHFIEWLESNSKSHARTFLDYGCGGSSIALRTATKLDFAAVGVEFDEGVRKLAAEYAGCPVVAPSDIFGQDSQFDVVLLGDVLEHVSDPQRLLLDLRRVMSNDGVIYVQGPLEGSPTLLHLFVSLVAILKPGLDDSLPPYHVSLATARSMRALAQRCGFRVAELRIFEVQWPAPSIRQALGSRSARALSLAGLKVVDSMVARLSPSRGNRFMMLLEKHE